MSIYTRTGDSGLTSTYNGKRILKSDPQIEAYGSIDELNSFIGLVISKLNSKPGRLLLTQIQYDLHQIMAFLSGAKTNIVLFKKRLNFFEQKIDKISLNLTKLTSFILPQGSETSAWFHWLRAVCRRTERRVINYFKKNQTKLSPQSLIIISYLNRLSDLFFVLARKHNRQKEIVV